MTVSCPIRVIRLSKSSLNDILRLQSLAIANNNPFTPSSRELYERAFRFRNFVYGIYDNQIEKLIGYCNCSIPTSKAKKNLGINLILTNELDYVGHINTILVAPQYRRHGYGELLLKQVITEFRLQEDIKYIFTTLYTINTPSLNLFRKHEFEIIKTIHNNDIEKYILKLTM